MKMNEIRVMTNDNRKLQVDSIMYKTQCYFQRNEPSVSRWQDMKVTNKIETRKFENITIHKIKHWKLDTRDKKRTNDIFPYRTRTMQMLLLLLMQRTPLLLLYPKEKRGRKERRKEKGREEEK
jgi:hypothetical protein